MRRIATLAAAGALLLLVPAAASAETASVAGGVLTHAGVAGQADFQSVFAGTSGSTSGQVIISGVTAAVPGPGCSNVTNEPSQLACSGVTSLDVSLGDRNDTLYVVVPLSAKVDLGDGDDDLWSSTGNDVITPGAGADDIVSGTGNDHIAARDGARDTIDCGGGTDTVVADADDAVTNCEGVERPAVAPPPPPVVDEKAKDDPPKAEPKAPEAPAPPVEDVVPAPPAVVSPLPAVSPVALVATAVQVGRDGVAPLELGCAVTEVGGCRGELFLDPAPQGRALGAAKRPKAAANGKAKAKRVKARMARRGRFGRSAFAVAAGGTAKLGVRLTPEARRALGLPSSAGKARAARRGRRVRAKVTVVQKGKKASVSIVELRG